MELTVGLIGRHLWSVFGLRYVFGVIKRSISQPQLPSLLGFVLNCHKHHIHTSLYLSPLYMTHKMFWVLIRFAIFFGLP